MSRNDDNCLHMYGVSIIYFLAPALTSNILISKAKDGII